MEMEQAMVISPLLVPIVLFIMGGVTAIGVPIAKAYARRIEREPRQPAMPPDVTARLERMEQALDSIAIEVERISEGQRFTTKLLSERNTTAASGLSKPPS
jgi:HPt (histidine-containing phosphotransfer) domain-containing protein